MAWSASKVIACAVLDTLKLTESLDWDTDTMTVALYNNSITPDNTAAQASNAYNTGQWATANEVYEAGQWAQAGVNLASVTVAQASNVVTFDAADTASGSAFDGANIYGCLVYDNTSTTTDDQGICYNYFGGANTVTNGTLTVIWNAGGIATFTT